MWKIPFSKDILNDKIVIMKYENMNKFETK